MFLRITSIVTVFSMLLVMLAGALHTHATFEGSVFVHREFERRLDDASGSCIGAPDMSLVIVDVHSAVEGHGSSDCNLCKVTKERVVISTGTHDIVHVAEQAPEIRYITPRIQFLRTVDASDRAPPMV